MEIKDYTTDQTPTWCPGCGAYGFIMALKKAWMEMDLKPEEIVMTYDIGCSGNMVNLNNVCGFATLHGRSIPVAVGVKMANPKLTVIAQGGDGGILSEGANHLIHAAQRNDDITVIINNNFVFGLTAGQTSSGTLKNQKTKTHPEGNPNEALSAVDLAAVAGATFIARVKAIDMEKTKDILKAAITHKGFSLVEVIQPCVIWAKDLTVTDGEYIEKPCSNVKDVIGRPELMGILFRL